MKSFTVVGASAIFAASAFVWAGAAVAQASTQTTTPAQANESASTATAPLELQLPPADPQLSRPFGGADSPGEYYGDHSGDGGEGSDSDDKSVQVHGSFTTGIGYSKGYGTSTMNAADIHISKHYDDGKTVDVQINIEQSKGPGFFPYGGYYGPRYRGY